MPLAFLPSFMKASFLVCAYNAEATVMSSIQSLQGQRFEDFEIVVVNDGSTDGTLGILERMAFYDKRIRVVRNSSNLGLTKSLNIGLAACRGEFVARHDADDFSLPERLSEQLDFIQKTGANFVVSRFLRNGRSHPLFYPSAVKSRNLMFGNFVCHGTFCFRRDVILSIGGYDEAHRVAQDYELLLRYTSSLKRAIPLQRKALYIFNSSSNGISAKNFMEQQESSLLAAQKHLKSAIGIKAPRVIQCLLRNLSI